MFLRVIEIGFVAVFALVIITQLILPPLFEKPFFWFFRRTEKGLRTKEVELMDVRAQKRAEKLDKRIEKERETIRKPEQK